MSPTTYYTVYSIPSTSRNYNCACPTNAKERFRRASAPLRAAVPKRRVTSRVLSELNTRCLHEGERYMKGSLTWQILLTTSALYLVPSLQLTLVTSHDDM